MQIGSCLLSLLPRGKSLGSFGQYPCCKPHEVALLDHRAHQLFVQRSARKKHGLKVGPKLLDVVRCEGGWHGEIQMTRKQLYKYCLVRPSLELSHLTLHCVRSNSQHQACNGHRKDGSRTALANLTKGIF